MRLPIVLFDVVGSYSSVNALTWNKKYTWDITGELANATFYGLSQLVVLAASPTNGIYQMYVYNNPAGTFTTSAQVVTGMNSLLIGAFENTGNIITGYSSLIISSINLAFLNVATHITDVSVGQGGSLIYNTGYSTALIGGLSRINVLNPFWINQPAMTNGPLNRCALNGAFSISSCGLFANVNVPSAQNVYVGFSSKVDVQIYINNALVISVQTAGERNAIASNVNTILGTSFTGADVLSDCWHMIPVTLNAGNNLLQFITNQSDSIFGFEVYNNTSAELAAATNSSDINVLYSTLNYVGQNLF